MRLGLLMGKRLERFGEVRIIDETNGFSREAGGPPHHLLTWLSFAKTHGIQKFSYCFQVFRSLD